MKALAEALHATLPELLLQRMRRGAPLNATLDRHEKDFKVTMRHPIRWFPNGPMVAALAKAPTG